MADTTITGLPTATSAASTDIIPIVQGGITKQLTNTLLFTSPVVAGTATVASAVFTGATTFTATSTFTSSTYFSVNVGVGTTALNLATLSRALSVGSSGASDTAGLELQTAGVLRGYVSASSSGVFITASSTNPLVFNTNGSERARIDSTGNLGLGTAAPNASAILDAQSTTKGVRFPNMTTTQKTAIVTPATGLVIFDTTLAKLCVYTGAAWQTITSV